MRVSRRLCDVLPATPDPLFHAACRLRRWWQAACPRSPHACCRPQHPWMGLAVGLGWCDRACESVAALGGCCPEAVTGGSSHSFENKRVSYCHCSFFSMFTMFYTRSQQTRGSLSAPLAASSPDIRPWLVHRYGRPLWSRSVDTRTFCVRMATPKENKATDREFGPRATCVGPCHGVRPSMLSMHLNVASMPIGSLSWHSLC